MSGPRTRRRGALALALAASGAMLAASCSRSPSSGPDASLSPLASGPVSSVSGTSTAPPTLLELLVTGDVGGDTDLCGCKVREMGGVARRARIVRDSKAEHPGRALVLDAGDHFFRTPFIASGEAARARETAHFLAASLERLDAAAIAVGERDLALGLGELRALGRESGAVLLAANLELTRTGTPAFPAFALVERGGVKVGIVGAALELEPGVQAEKLYTRDGLTVRPAAPALAGAAAAARRAGARFVVALLHTGERRAREVLSQLPRGSVDLAIAAHDKNAMPGVEIIHPGWIGLLSAGDRGKWIASIQVRVQPRASGVADVRALAQDRRTIDQIDARIEAYESADAGALAPEVAAKVDADRRATIERLRRRKRAMIEEVALSDSSGKHAIEYELVPIDAALPEDPEMRAALDAHKARLEAISTVNP